MANDEKKGLNLNAAAWFPPGFVQPQPLATASSSQPQESTEVAPTQTAAAGATSSLRLGPSPINRVKAFNGLNYPSPNDTHASNLVAEPNETLTWSYSLDRVQAIQYEHEPTRATVTVTVAPMQVNSPEWLEFHKRLLNWMRPCEFDKEAISILSADFGHIWEADITSLVDGHTANYIYDTDAFNAQQQVFNLVEREVGNIALSLSLYGRQVSNLKMLAWQYVHHRFHENVDHHLDV